MKKVKIVILMFFLVFMINIKTYAAARVIYDVKELSVGTTISGLTVSKNSITAKKFLITLKWSDGNTSNLKITSYDKVDDNTVEVYYETNANFDVRSITIDTELLNMKLYNLNKPNVILKDQNGKVNTLSDLPLDEEMRASIENLYSRGIINGYEDGTFKPNNTITREEFASMFCNLFKYEVRTDLDSIFADVPNTRWSKNIIMSLNSYDVVHGLGDGNFGAEKTITLGEIATMITNAEKLQPVPTSGIYPHLNTQHWSNQSITNLITYGYLKTSDKMYSNRCQEKELTRAEVALILNRLRAIR